MRPRLLAATLAAAMTVAASLAHADEGMWMPRQLPQIAGALRAAGFAGDPAALADVTADPLAAVVSLGGCTASFVSPQGLIVTNHHCAMGAIQLNSTPEKNLIRDGFIAATIADEVSAGPAARAFVTVGFDDVTARVLEAARGKTGRAYYEAVEAARKAIVAECEREPGMRCSVADMYYGLQFFRIRQLELKDIRLVYAPPESIGNYGDEIDNFMWPRHSGDFAFYRAYVGQDGKPAAYSRDNVPYRPPAVLPVSTAPLQAGQFVMVAGYPGVTFRLRTAMEFANQVGWVLPNRVAMAEGLIRTIEQATAGDPRRQVLYASSVASLKNTLKRAQGELEGLRRSDAVALRRADEDAMLAWLARQPGSTAQRRDIQAVMAQLAAGQAQQQRDSVLGYLRTGLLGAAITLQRLAHERAKPDAQREAGYQQRDEALIEANLKQLSRRYDPEVEQAILGFVLARYYALPADQRVPEVEAVFGGDLAQATDLLRAMYAATRFGDEATRLAAMRQDAAALAASDDPLLKAAARLQPAWLRLEDAAKQREGELLRLRPAYMRALIAYRQTQGRAVYPDANGTLRVSYGHIAPLAPRDGVEYRPFTTVAGILEKHTGQAPFDAPAPLREAIAKGDFGSTADPLLKTQTVDFLSNLDTTGGNSGSPVLDAHGRLVGLNFDSNWEAVSASWMYDPRYKRAIHVDMRYLRWILAKVYPAPALLREMGLPPE
ncbi:S46 family peptidase [Thermomonas flagellata]|uniref:S46 family peptidase n=1 Tax=Thermomonas flagellata TaxID=2888524 RepID=UPI001F04E89B|nr:S46 family peptidase [Thermomonas flagellata]